MTNTTENNPKLKTAQREQLLSSARAEMQPSWLSVFAKWLPWHIVASLLGLTLCPQFGHRLFFDGHGLMQVFASLMGHTWCYLLCGAFYIFLSLSVAFFALTPSQWRVLKQNAAQSSLAISVVSILAFALIGAEIFTLTSALWMIGSLGTALLSLKLPKLLAQIN